MISNMYQYCLNSEHYSRLYSFMVENYKLLISSLSTIDESTKLSVVIGLICGLGIILFLGFFPGEPMGICYGPSFDENDPIGLKKEAYNNISKEEKISNGKMNPNKVMNHDTKENNNTNEDNVDDDNETSAKKATDASWPGDSLDQSKIIRIQSIFKLSDDQMNDVLKMSKEEAFNKRNNNYDDIISLESKVNWVVYIVLFALLIYILNRDYGNIVTWLFIRTFPKEAKLLRL